MVPIRNSPGLMGDFTYSAAVSAMTGNSRPALSEVGSGRHLAPFQLAATERVGGKEMRSRAITRSPVLGVYV